MKTSKGKQTPKNRSPEASKGVFSGSKAAFSVGAALLTMAISAGSLQAGEFVLGASAVKFKAPYKGFKDDSSGALLAEYHGENWSVGTDGINYRLLGSEQEPLSLYATLTSVGYGFDQGDSDFFSGMDKRDNSLDLGISASYQIGEAMLTGALLHDISGSHKGFVADAGFSRSLDLGFAELTPAVGVSYVSDDYADYYFGVRSHEVTATRTAYSAEGGFNPYVGYELVVPMTDSWHLIHTADYVWLSDEISDSSLVDRNNTWSASLGVAYVF